MVRESLLVMKTWGREAEGRTESCRWRASGPVRSKRRRWEGKQDGLTVLAP